jgi:hypothetical protein
MALPNPSSRTMALWSTQPLTEMSTRNLPGGKGRPACKADNLTAICQPWSRKCVSLDVSQPYGPPWSLTGIAIARQRLGKHIPAEAKAPKNMTSIARKRICKHDSLTIETVFTAWSVHSGYK